MNGVRITSFRQQGGMALIVVLWLIVLLSIMAAGHSRNAHTDTKLASRQIESAKARALAEAGINHVILEMLADNTDAALPVDGSVFTVKIYDDVVTMAIRDATGLVDLNAADPDLLGATLRACGIEENEERELVDAILDWRDKDDLAHLHGIEDEDYRAAGLPWSSRDGAFASIDELKYIPVINHDLFERLAAFVTVYSHRGGINLEYAPPALITALTGNEVRPATPEGTSRKTSGARNGTYHIYSSVAGGSGVNAALEVVVRISRSSGPPFTVLDWREPPRAEFPPRQGEEV